RGFADDFAHLRVHFFLKRLKDFDDIEIRLSIFDWNQSGIHLDQFSILKIQVNSSDVAAGNSRFRDQSLAEPHWAKSFMVMPGDDEPNLRKGANEPLFLFILEMNGGDNEIRPLSNFRQECFETLHDIEDFDSYDVVWMAQCFNSFCGEANNSESNPLRRDYCVFLNSTNRRCYVGG